MERLICMEGTFPNSGRVPAVIRDLTRHDFDSYSGYQK